MSDEEMVVLVKSFLARPDGTPTRGETLACDEFVRMCAPVIRARMRRACAAGGEIEDLSQDGWLTLLRRMRRFEFDPRRAPLIAWVSAMMNRLAGKYARRRERRVVPLPETDDVVLVDPEPRPDEELEWMHQHELFGTLVSAFASSLPERDGLIVIRRFMEFKAVPEIARELNLSDRCVRSVLHRLVPRLRLFLHARGSRPV